MFALSLLFAAVALCGCGDDPTDSKVDEEIEDGSAPVIREFYFLYTNNVRMLNGDISCIICEDDVITNVAAVRPKRVICSGSKLIPTFKVGEGHKVYVAGEEQTSGVSEQEFAGPVCYKVVNGAGEEREYVVSLKFESSKLPIVQIETAGHQSIASKKDWVGATISIDGGEEFDDLELCDVQIAGRGNSTWLYDKKPYKLKFGSKTEVLGMPKHKRWVLLANYIDKTMLRNDVAFYLGKQTSLAWTPRGYHVELVLNGDYRGTYYLCEQIKIDKNRVNITEMDPDSEDVTGGYLLEMDTYTPDDDETRFYSKRRAATGDYIPVKIKDPEAADLSEAQFDYIKGYFHAFEDALYGSDWLDAEKGYKNLIDVDSFIDIYLVSELIYHSEWGHPKSSYMHKNNNGGKLVSGPMWDYDWTTFTKRTGWYCRYTLWYNRMFQDPEFVTLLKQRWTELYPKFYSAIDYMREMRDKLSFSAEMNYNVWDPAMPNSPNGEGSMTYYQAVDKIIDRYTERIEWLNSEFSKL